LPVFPVVVVRGCADVALTWQHVFVVFNVLLSISLTWQLVKWKNIIVNILIKRILLPVW
jgi:hypothetical protein